MPIEVDYRFPPGVDAARQAQQIAIGQTAGTWDERYAHRHASLRRFLGEVAGLTALPGGGAVATIRFPEHNVEGDIGSLLTMIFGKYSMAGPAKVVDLRLPDGYGTPAKLGAQGIRRRSQVAERPLVMAIFKPSLGLSPTDLAAVVDEVGVAGLDVIKDDEIMADLPGARTLDRMSAVRGALDRVASARGRPLLYAVNVTGRSADLLESARRLVRAGANALLVNVLSYGFSVLESLAADAEVDVPLFVHPALSGALCAAPDHGLTYSVVLGHLCAHAGADAVLYPSRHGSLPFEAAEELRIRDALRPRRVLPVLSAGVTPAIVPQIIADYGHDVVLNAGTAIMEHRDGPAGGVRAFFAALEQMGIRA